MSELKKSSILLSGGSGYLGGHFARYLLDLGHHVAFLTHTNRLEDIQAAYPQQVSCFSLEDLWQENRDIFPDILPDIEFDFCFHIAGLYEAETTPEAEKRMKSANFEVGEIMLQRALSQPIPACFIHIGSFWQEPGVAANNYYTYTKNLMSDLLRKKSGEGRLKSVTLRLFDLYGPQDNRKKLLPYLASLENSSEAVPLTLGEQIMCPIFLVDAISGLAHAAAWLDNEASDGTHCFFDLGGQPISLKEFVLLWREVSQQQIEFDWGEIAYRADQIFWPLIGAPIPGWRLSMPLREGLHLSYAPSV